MEFLKAKPLSVQRESSKKQPFHSITAQAVFGLSLVSPSRIST